MLSVAAQVGASTEEVLGDLEEEMSCHVRYDGGVQVGPNEVVEETLVSPVMEGSDSTVVLLRWAVPFGSVEVLPPEVSDHHNVSTFSGSFRFS